MVRVHEVGGTKTMKCPECKSWMKYISCWEESYFLCMNCNQVEFEVNKNQGSDCELCKHFGSCKNKWDMKNLHGSLATWCEDFEPVR